MILLARQDDKNYRSDNDDNDDDYSSDGDGSAGGASPRKASSSLRSTATSGSFRRSMNDNVRRSHFLK